MARNPQQLAQIAMRLWQATRGKLSAPMVIGLVVLALLYAAVIQPAIEARFGVALPSIDAPADPTPKAKPSKPSGRPQGDNADTPIAPSDLPEVLTDVGRGAYRSPAGLRYTRGSVHGHRLAHLLSHARDDPDRPGQHGVFDEDDPAAVVSLVDEAYEQALAGENTRTRREDERTVYEVDLGRRVGYIGGESGNRRGRPRAEHVRLVVEGDRLITAFPFRP